MGLGFNVDLTSAFNANKKTQLIIEPHARFYPKSFALDNYILNQKYSQRTKCLILLYLQLSTSGRPNHWMFHAYLRKFY